MREVDSLIGEYTHEKHRPQADAALQTLRKIASMVKPIMRQRGWRVGTLSEFFPEQQNLLGLNYNHGQRICIRLRYPRDESLFLPLEEVIDTMLHELTHNVFGPHDGKFHKLWNELRDEYEALLRKGYTGEGFLSAGQKLGGSGIKPIHEARRLARAAAEKRRIQSANGPRRVGGSAPSDRVDIRKTIADAAQRRRDILKGCGNTDTDPGWQDKVLEETRRNEIHTTAEIDDADMRAVEQAFMEMVKEDEERQTQAGNSFSRPDNPPDRQMPGQAMGPPPLPVNSKPRTTSTPSSEIPRTIQTPSISQTPKSTKEEEKWTCEICTFDNTATFLCCGVCLVERPSKHLPSETTTPTTQRHPSSSARPPPSLAGGHKILRSRTSASNIARFTDAEIQAANSKPLGWACHGCGTFMESQWWTCSQCGTMKLNS